MTAWWVSRCSPARPRAWPTAPTRRSRAATRSCRSATPTGRPTRGTTDVAHARSAGIYPFADPEPRESRKGRFPPRGSAAMKLEPVVGDDPREILRALRGALHGAGPALGLGMVDRLPSEVRAGTAVVVTTSGSTGVPQS